MSMPLVSNSSAAASSEKPRVVRRGMYRHEPYAARLIEAIPPPQTLQTPFPISDACVVTPTRTPRYDPCVSPTCGATDTSSNYTSCELPPVIQLKTADSFMALVRFKYGAKEFFSPFSVEVGQAVITEGDRGEDLGFVQHVRRVVAAAPPPPTETIFRVATTEDLDMHYRRAPKEEEALHTMRVLARQVKCPAFIQDIMYQLDAHKITVVIARDTKSYVDFRRLQRAAFDVFRCRVWCAYLDEIAVPQTGSEAKLHTQRAMHGRRPHRSAYVLATRDVNAGTY